MKKYRYLVYVNYYKSDFDKYEFYANSISELWSIVYVQLDFNDIKSVSILSITGISNI